MTRFKPSKVSAVTLNRGLLKLATRGSYDLQSAFSADLCHRKNRQGLLMHFIRMHYARHEYGAVRKVSNGSRNDSND